MTVYSFVPIYPMSVEIFQWIIKNFDLQVALDESSAGHQSQDQSGFILGGS